MTGPVFRARAGAPVAWPAAFGRRFLVSVDVEEEFDWRLPLAQATRAVTHLPALAAWHATVHARGVRPLYLVDYPVVCDDDAAAVLRALLREGAQIGAQLHPWVNPPDARAQDGAGSFVGNLPPPVEGAKMDALLDAIVGRIGTRAIAYRAGRYGIGTATAALLAKRGIALDVSMRARHDYTREGGPDFTAIGSDAFFLSPDVVEVPLSTIDTGVLRFAAGPLDALALRVPHGRGLLARTRLLSRVPLTPEGVSGREAVRAVAAAARDGTRLLQLAFHSPSLVPGHTPYVRDAGDLGRLHRWWDVVLTALERHGYAPAAASEVIAAATGRPGRT